MTDPATLPDYRGLFDLTGKTALVTGACGILGRHFASALAAHGATVVALDLEQDAVDGLVEALKASFGAAHRGVACDLSDAAMVEETIRRLDEETGGIDVLHSNAATKGTSLEAMFEPAETYAHATWREHMAVNLDGAFHVMRCVGAGMKTRGNGGSIISTVSIYGLMGPDNRIYEGSEYLGRAINTPPSYAAAKAGLVGLTRYFAAHWGLDGIRVNAIAPGGVASGQNETFQTQYGSRVPMGRMGRADEMVGALVWLASDASSYVTGQVLAVDGGLSAW